MDNNLADQVEIGDLALSLDELLVNDKDDISGGTTALRPQNSSADWLAWNHDGISTRNSALHTMKLLNLWYV